MQLDEHLARAREAKRKATEQRHANTLYHFTWRSGGGFTLVGASKAAEYLGWKLTTLATNLSAGAGEIKVLRNHPATGEPDALYVTRQLPQSAAKPKGKRGRPRKQPDNARLFGTEDAS